RIFKGDYIESAVEISLHSFVNDGLAILDGLDEDIKNRILLDIKGFDAKFVQSLTSTTDECRNKFESATIQYYSSTKQYTKYPELLGMGEDLDLEPGVWYSRASSQRRNKKRENLSVKKTPGHECEWAFISCQTNHLEITAVEVKTSDDGPNGTDCLKDNLKLSKLLKNMFDMISMSMKSENLDLIKSTLAVYGIIISGLKLEIVLTAILTSDYFSLMK
ncbi:hypothetical protein BGZ46_003597, partial [Entomortierella lignicola]